MMKKFFVLSFGSIVTLLFIASCDKEQYKNRCVSYTTAQVTNVARPNNISVNQEADLTVSYYLSNGCGKFERLEAIASGNTTVISLKSKYEGCVCTDMLLSGQTNYKFKAEQAGVHYLKFLQPNSTYLTDTIIVN